VRGIGLLKDFKKLILNLSIHLLKIFKNRLTKLRQLIQTEFCFSNILIRFMLQTINTSEILLKWQKMKQKRLRKRK